MAVRTYQRVDLAVEQLDTALMLFLDLHRFAAALTLAGAAEEVLGKELNRLDWQAAIGRRLSGHTASDRKERLNNENRVRNALKHYDAKDEPQITADLQEAARWMLERACENAHKLELHVPRADEFGAWYCKTLVERDAAAS